jgi:glycerol kinase
MDKPALHYFSTKIPIAGVAGDQQAALLDNYAPNPEW